MNIIKFKDVIRVNDLQFNHYLKGKFAYFIRMRYAVPIECVTVQNYMDMEADLEVLYSSDIPYWDMQNGDMAAYMDAPGTDEANDVSIYIRHNKHVSDSDITEDEVRKFRSWLAQTLLELDKNCRGEQLYKLFDEQFTYMLQYYANGMYNEVIKRLSEIHKLPMPAVLDKCGSLQPIIPSTCGCGSVVQPMVPGTTCDPISSYRTFVHDVMVRYFGQVYFWSQMPRELLCDFKHYIDNIVCMNLPLTDAVETDKYIECGKMSETNQHLSMNKLMNLSKALEYMIDDEISGHRNFINDSLTAWATELYEKMQWTKK